MEITPISDLENVCYALEKAKRSFSGGTESFRLLEDMRLTISSLIREIEENDEK